MKKSYYILTDSSGKKVCIFSHEDKMFQTEKKIKQAIADHLGCEKENIVFKSDVLDYEPLVLPTTIGEDDSITLEFVWSIDIDDEFMEKYTIEKVEMY